MRSQQDTSVLQSSVLTTICEDDTMFEGDTRHYFAVGLSALQCIELAMAASE